MWNLFFVTTFCRNSFGSVTWMICFSNAVDEIYTSFSSRFGTDFLISFHTLVLSGLSLIGIALFAFPYFVFKTSTFLSLILLFKWSPRVVVYSWPPFFLVTGTSVPSVWFVRLLVFLLCCSFLSCLDVSGDPWQFVWLHTLPSGSHLLSFPVFFIKYFITDFLAGSNYFL